MAAKKRTVPTPAEIKRLAKAHTKAESALRHAELKVMVAKTTARKHR
ncbi:MAG: hypothetical protein WC977_02040 [Anaerovoracaceae bacterium]|jgi:hypothetical protein